MPVMHFEVLPDIRGVTAGEWNAIAGGDNPFVAHEFLSALEASDCACEAAGWIPQHLTVRDGTGALTAAAPAYLKLHSYGEYVFDWAWASAYEQAGLDYYPKLVLAVPFSPVTGPRLLSGPSPAAAESLRLLIDGAERLARDTGASSIHCLFPRAEDLGVLEAHGWLRRSGFQFHWQNRDYADFEHFLAGFSAQKRKKIRHERRAVRESGITMEVRTGGEVTENHWRLFYECYRNTIERHGGIPYLNLDFFMGLGRTMPQKIVMVLARREGRHMAAALNLLGRDALFGRYWGQLEPTDNLHFEACYYTPIEWCIEHRLSRFEAGAQGTHKLSRGLLPAPTYSVHWLSRPDFSRAISEFLMREHRGVEYHMNELDEHGPFKRDLWRNS
ncbi:MAG: GNAT family N-acetyltransferase [Acidiferrobacteraceae bacterium]